MGSPGGYSVNPGMYRVPDLLTEDQFVQYMKSTYGVDISFDHGDTEPMSPARALGQSRSMGVVNEDDTDKQGPAPINDPVLRSLNNRNFSTVEVPEEKTEEKSTTNTKSTSSTKK